MIRDNKAALIQNAEEFVQIMGWSVAEQPARTEGIQRNLFPELTEEEELVVRILMRQETSISMRWWWKRIYPSTG